MNPITNTLVWKGATEDGRHLLLTDAGLKKIGGILPKDPQLKALVNSNFNGNLKGAIVRSIQQLTQNARYAGNLRCNKSGKRYQVFVADIGGKNYQIIAQPLDSQQNLIIAIRSQITDTSIEEESGRGHSRVHVAIDNYLRNLRIAPRWGKAQIHSQNTRQTNRQNKPDLSYVDRAGKRVNIEIDTSDKRSHTHDKNQTWDPGAKHIYYVVGPESGKVISRRTWDPVKKNWDDKKYANQGVPVSSVIRGIEGKPTPPPQKNRPTNRKTKGSREAELYGLEEYRYV